MQSVHRAAIVRSIGVSDCPFLSQSKSILQKVQESQYKRSFNSKSILSKLHQPRKNVEDEEFKSEPTELASFLKQKAAEVASNKSKMGRSITSAEQAAFDSIRELFKKPPPSTVKARATSTDHTDTDYKNILDLFASLPKDTYKAETDQIAPETIDRNEPRPTEERIDAEVDHRHLEDFQTEIVPDATSHFSRGSAMAEIRGFLRESTSPPDLTDRSVITVRSAALSIVEDVADSLTTALASQNLRPDIALWRVAEEKIFPLIQLLRPSSSTLSSPAPSQSISGPISQHEAAQEQPEPQTPTQVHPLIPTNLPILPVLSQTYPSLTLLILRLYAAYHPTSPYALSLLPTLKSLGPTSYVLGAHTHFYNTLLLLYWRIYSDLRGMNKLLSEMESNGVEFDIGTWETLKSVGDDRQKDLDGQGERNKRWWIMMEQRNWWPRVGVEWREVVKRRLEEKGLLTGEVMREESGQLSTSGNDGDGPEYVVTL